MKAWGFFLAFLRKMSLHLVSQGHVDFFHSHISWSPKTAAVAVVTQSCIFSYHILRTDVCFSYGVLFRVLGHVHLFECCLRQWAINQAAATFSGCDFDIYILFKTEKKRSRPLVSERWRCSVYTSTLQQKSYRYGVQVRDALRWKSVGFRVFLFNLLFCPHHKLSPNPEHPTPLALWSRKIHALMGGLKSINFC